MPLLPLETRGHACQIPRLYHAPMKRTSTFAAVLVAVLLTARAQEEPVDQQHQREETGVNPYTAPEVEEIFKQLDDVKPLPFEQLKRDFPQTFPAAREQLGLIFGSLIADGFLIVECEKKN